MADLNEFGLSADPTLIVAIDTPHLAIGPRVHHAVRQILASLKSTDITVVSNLPCPAGIHGDNIHWLTLSHRGPLADEKQFFADFAHFANVPLLAETRLPESGLPLFDIIGLDGLVYPYRATCELDLSALDGIDPQTQQIVLIGGSHFNHPLPECALAKLTSDTPCIGVPIGPLTGPFAPHWLAHCDRFIVTHQQQSATLKKHYPQTTINIHTSLNASDSACEAHITHSTPTLMIDWTFAHMAQLRQLLEALSADDRIPGIALILTAGSAETSDLLAKKWPTLVERLSPTFVIVNSDAWHTAVASADIAVTFAGGRDLWQMRRDDQRTIVCDFADWRNAFDCDEMDAIACPADAADVIVDAIDTLRHRSQENAR